jgi:ABC transport system ATP-binding/permease protein
MRAMHIQKLILKEGPNQGECYVLESAELVIGREPGVELQIEAPGVSRRHARLLLQGSAYLLEDLGSSNGTFLNGQRLTAQTLLKTGDRIGLGLSVQLEYQVEQPAVQETMLEGIAPVSPSLAGTLLEAPSLEGPALAGSALESTVIGKRLAGGVGATLIGEEPLAPIPSDPPQLSITIAGGKPVTYTLTQAEVNIGRASDNQIVIDSRIVSRHHARLLRVEAGYQLLVIPEAGNPLLLEGRPVVGTRLLRHGDILRIGSLDPGTLVTLVYRQPEHAQAPRRARSALERRA